MAVVWPSKNNFANGDVLTAANMNNIGDTLNVFNPTSATNGQVWIANGSGSGAYGVPTTTTWNLIASANLPAATSVSITSIPQTYRQIFIIFRNITVGTTSSPRFWFNGVTSSHYKYIKMFDSSSSTSGSGGLVPDIAPQGNDNVGGTNTNGSLFIYCPTYSVSCFQTGQFAFAYNGTSIPQLAGGFFSFGTATVDYTITGINLGNWASNMTGGTYELYGAT